MIVCSCNVITHREIREAIDRLRTMSPDSVLTPGLVYRSLGYRPRCGGCLSHVVQIIHGLPPEEAAGAQPCCCQAGECACMAGADVREPELAEG